MTRCSTSSPTSPPSAWARRPAWAPSCWPRGQGQAQRPARHARIMIHQPMRRHPGPGHQHRDLHPGNPQDPGSDERDCWRSIPARTRGADLQGQRPGFLHVRPRSPGIRPGGPGHREARRNQAGRGVKLRLGAGTKIGYLMCLGCPGRSPGPT